MLYFLLLVGSFIILVAKSVTMRNSNRNQVYYQESFINNRPVSIPSSLLSLDNGDHTVNFNDIDITVQLKRTDSNIIDTIISIEDAHNEINCGAQRSTLASCIGLILEITKNSAINQKAKINFMTTDKVRTVHTISISIFFLPF